jgi:Cu-Zn family superoxide dismutase
VGHRASLCGRRGCALFVVLALSGCQNSKDPLSDLLGTGPNVEARLVAANGATLTGAAILHAYAGGVVLTLNFNGRGPGQYRVAIHATGNCTSRNAFSAGPPWAPPGTPLVVEQAWKNDDSLWMTVRLPGYKMDGPDGIMGRSVVVHAGSAGSLEAQPGVPNDRIACGVIGPPKSLFPQMSSLTSPHASTFRES